MAFSKAKQPMKLVATFECGEVTARLLAKAMKSRYRSVKWVIRRKAKRYTQWGLWLDTAKSTDGIYVGCRDSGAAYAEGFVTAYASTPKTIIDCKFERVA